MPATLPETRYGTSDFFQGSHVPRLFPLAARPQGIVGFDSPDLAQDASVTVHELLDSTQTVVRRVMNTAWGEDYPGFTPLLGPTERYQFSHREKDSESGLGHHRYRTLDYRTGRFIQRDPARGTRAPPTPQFGTLFAYVAPVSWNFYTYVDNAPTRFTDQLGLFRIISPPIHEEITRSGLFGYFEGPAIERFVQQNIQADTAQFGDPVAHFDNGLIEEGWTRVAQRRSNIVDTARKSLKPSGNIEVSAAAGDIVEINFGRLLHAVQDFYSHSNYIELYIRSMGQRPSGGAAAWPFPKLPTIDEVRMNPQFMEFAQLLDQALTSGAYGAEEVARALKEGKPTHDDIYETSVFGLRREKLISFGLNKDEPSRPLHTLARDLAIRETSIQARKLRDSLNLWVGEGGAGSFWRLIGGKE